MVWRAVELGVVAEPASMEGLQEDTVAQVTVGSVLTRSLVLGRWRIRAVVRWLDSMVGAWKKVRL